MPLIKRTVSPVNIALTKVVESTRNELEYVTNSSLASIIRQLSSLSKHAEDMFSELVHEATIVFDRANNLQERVGRLKVKVTQLDSTVEEVSLQDINLRKPFKSSLAKDQQVIDLSSRPAAIDVIYRELCEPPPMLSKLNPFREDGKESLKFYTDPQYFIELWYTKMQLDAEQQKRRKKTSRGQSMLRQGIKVREPTNKHDKQQQAKHGPELASYSKQQHQGGNDANHQPPQQKQPSHQGNGEWQQSAAATRQQQQAARPGADGAYGGQAAVAGQRASAVAQTPAGQGAVMKKSTSSDQQGAYPGSSVQFQQQSAAVQQQMSASTYNYVGQYVMQQQQLQQEMMQQQQGQYNATTDPYGRQQQKPQSPVKRISNEPTPSSAYPSGTAQGQAAIPEHLQHGSLVGVQMRFGSDSHESLPPPPPPPPQEDNGGIGDAAPARNSKTNVRSPPAVFKKPTSIRQSSSPQPFPGNNQHELSSSPRNFDGGFDALPPPPHMFHDSAVAGSPSAATQFQLPPITPPPPMDYDDDLLPTPPPMQLIQSPTMLNHDRSIMNGNGSVGGAGIPGPPEPPVYAQPDFNSYPSADSLGNVEAKEDSGGSADAVMDTRSDLLAAIRKGLQLRKVEEQRIKKEQQKMPAPSAAGGNKRLDVQAIMEAAFEARRQMLEDSESDYEDGDENGEWSD